MQFILIRHGHKSSHPLNDPELSEKGIEQSQLLFDHVEKGLLKKPTHCWYSDKIRTRQTLGEVIARLNPIVFEKNELSTRSYDESPTHFKQRVQKFITELEQHKASQEVHFVCSHYDWIEEALLCLNTDKNLNTFEYAHWSPGQYLVFEWNQTFWKVLNSGELL